MTLDRKTLTTIAVLVAAWWWLSGPAPRPGPRPDDRPVLRWIAKAAKNLLWVAVFVEPAPPEPAAPPIHARVDAGGNRILDNGSTL